ncbi:MAG: hypothetical protein AAFR19_11385 [Pseudomonadota bacterium]
MKEERFLIFGAAILAAATVSSSAHAETALTSAGAMAFGVDDTLFVGDTYGAKVVAFDMKNVLADQSSYSLGRPETFEGRTIVPDLLGALSQNLAAPAAQLTINDVAVHGPTQQIVLSGHRGLGPDAMPFLAVVDQGELRILDHEALPSTQHELQGPNSDDTLEFGQQVQSYAITDIDYYDGELFVAGVSGENFNSTLRRVAYPFEADASAETQIEIWHAVHAQWETRAPIIAQTITELDGVPTLIAVYACTPLVRIPLTDLTDGAQIRGEMIGELGYGNTPVDIIEFTNPNDGSQNVLITHTHRTANQISLPQIAEAEPMPVEVANNFGPAGLVGFPVPATGIHHLAMVNEGWSVAVRPDPQDPQLLQLHTLFSPFFFDRADHMVEMNWPGTPDPFGYRQFPPLDL